ncbi:MAG TPA: type IX secretion system membrane protein PorP/SprF [Bacteroidetes bacterium]|nr:type IX secretion system membrane protein PorP/SprF [Bacteroidota bacterium]
MDRLPLLVVCLLLASTQTFSQQLSLFTQYRENQTIINPAAVGNDFFSFNQNLSFGLSHRTQWQGIAGAPKTSVLRGEYLYPTGGAVSLLTGGYLINDQTGPTGFTGLYGRVGGLLSDDPYYGGISVGLSFGAVQYRVDGSEIRLRQSGDVLSGQDVNQINPDVGVGVFAYTLLDGGFFNDDYLYGGLSIPQAIGLDLTFKDKNGEFSTKRVQHYYAMLGLYKFFRGGGFLEPSVWVKYAGNAPLNIDFNLRYQMAQNFWLGLGGATSKTIHLETGILVGDNLGFDNTFKIGYGFDYSFNSFGPYTGGSHEINISYSIDNQ